MAELLDKLSSYNLFNYLLPGIVFAVVASKFTHYSFLGYEILIAAFIYYFMGLVISRFGSLVIEPALKHIGFVRFAEYKRFVVASKKDQKIELMSEVNNTYRTLCSLFVLLLFLKLYEQTAVKWPVIDRFGIAILVLLLLVMFAFAYRKQTEFVRKRIEVSES